MLDYEGLTKKLTYDEANSQARSEWLEKGAYPLDRTEYHGWLGYHNPITGATEVYEPIGEPGKEVYNLRKLIPLDCMGSCD